MVGICSASGSHNWGCLSPLVFSEVPFPVLDRAGAGAGQVHEATTLDGRDVVMKVGAAKPPPPPFPLPPTPTLPAAAVVSWRGHICPPPSSLSSPHLLTEACFKADVQTEWPTVLPQWLSKSIADSSWAGRADCHRP